MIPPEAIPTRWEGGIAGLCCPLFVGFEGTAVALTVQSSSGFQKLLYEKKNINATEIACVLIHCFWNILQQSDEIKGDYFAKPRLDLVYKMTKDRLQLCFQFYDQCYLSVGNFKLIIYY